MSHTKVVILYNVPHYMEVAQKDQKTVLYVITKATWGGAQKYVFDLITDAKERGVRALLAYGEPGTLSERVQALGIPTHQIEGLQRDISILNDIRAFRSFFRILKEVRPDVVHLNSSKAGFAGAIASRISRVPKVIFTVHGWAFTEPRNIFSKALFTLLHYFTVDLCHVTIANSNATAAYAKRWPFVKHKIHTIPLGIESITFKSREDARALLKAKDPSLSVRPDTLWIGTIAELHPNKGLDIGIRAWKRAGMQDAQWVVLGGGQDELRLEAQARTTGGVHFIGFVPDAQQYLKAFDAFLLPSRTESFGYVLLEAGLASLPVIATSVGGVPEVVGGAGVLVPANTPEELAKALKDMCENPDKRTQLGEALRTRVQEKFSLSNMRDTTFALYI